MTHADIDNAQAELRVAISHIDFRRVSPVLDELVRLAHLGLVLEQPESEWAQWMSTPMPVKMRHYEPGEQKGPSPF